MNWQIFLLISILCESFGRIVQRILLKDNQNNPIAFAICSQLLTGSLLLTVALLIGFKWPENLLSLAPNLILMSIFYGYLNIFAFQALKYTEASVFTILFTSRALIIIILAVILLHEPFSLKQAAGTILIVFSIVLISLKKEKIQFKKGELFSLLAAVAVAFGAINDTYILKRVDVKINQTCI